MTPLQIAALILFIAMYVVMVAKQEWRVYAIWAVAIAFVIIGVLGSRSPLYLLSSINWNVIMMIGGTMLIVYYFTESKMPNLLAEKILGKCSNVMWVIILMSLFAGAVSAFIDNVATVLMIAPVALAVCRKLDISPVPMILSVAVSSNLQGAATLVGDTTSIMLGGYAGMNFMDFFWMNGRLGIFWSVELGALATVPIMMLLFHRYNQPVDAETTTKVTNFFPTIALCSVVVCLIIVSFIPNTPSFINGLICCIIAGITMVEDILRTKGTDKIRPAVLSVDFETLLILCGLFLVIQGITDVGLIDLAAKLIAEAGGGNLFLLYFIDNIPYVATMLPIIRQICALMGIDPYLLYFGLLTGATLGGNITPIGASANITAVGILKKEGHSTSFGDFMKIGVPFTLTAVIVSGLSGDRNQKKTHHQRQRIPPEREAAVFLSLP